MIQVKGPQLAKVVVSRHQVGVMELQGFFGLLDPYFMLAVLEHLAGVRELGIGL